MVFNNGEKQRASFNYVDVVHSVDRIRFISKLRVDEQQALIPETELRRHCSNAPDTLIIDPVTGEIGLVGVWYGEAGRQHGFITQVAASACNDHFISRIKDLDAGAPIYIALSYIEVCQDVVFKTMAEAEAFGEWFGQNVRYRDRKKHLKKFTYKTTHYLGTEYGVPADNYVRGYARESKMPEILHQPCFHCEFALTGAKTIYRALGINHYRYLFPAAEMFYYLENKFLQYRNEGETAVYRAFTAPKGRKYGSTYISSGEYNRLKGRLRK